MAQSKGQSPYLGLPCLISLTFSLHSALLTPPTAVSLLPPPTHHIQACLRPLYLLSFHLEHFSRKSPGIAPLPPLSLHLNVATPPGCGGAAVESWLMTCDPGDHGWSDLHESSQSTILGQPSCEVHTFRKIGECFLRVQNPFVIFLNWFNNLKKKICVYTVMLFF
uniref:Uncharacterized protein n=1 Tax=Myotis myotis TaxID=51298 RepID=A0A7J8AMJ7_MYOMY|nr:hypothetical protein mMyoMyo1_008127 [Myotis myotis]